MVNAVNDPVVIQKYFITSSCSSNFRLGPEHSIPEGFVGAQVSSTPEIIARHVHHVVSAPVWQFVQFLQSQHLLIIETL